MSSDAEPVIEGLFLDGREQVETAWQAAAITGRAPRVESLLEGMLEIHLPPQYRTAERHLSLFLGGESGMQAKEEVVYSLKGVIEHLGTDSDTSKAAQALLAILHPE